MRTKTIFVGAEGAQEVEGLDWVREATPEEIETLRLSLREAWLGSQEAFDAGWKQFGLDRIGRPYFPLTILETAPWKVWEKASHAARCLRLTD